MRRLALILGAVGAMALPGCRPQLSPYGQAVNRGLWEHAAAEAISGELNPKQTNVEVDVRSNQNKLRYTEIFNNDTGEPETTINGWGWYNYIKSKKGNFPKTGYGIFEMQNGKVIDHLRVVERGGIIQRAYKPED